LAKAEPLETFRQISNELALPPPAQGLAPGYHGGEVTTIEGSQVLLSEALNAPKLAPTQIAAIAAAGIANGRE